MENTVNVVTVWRTTYAVANSQLASSPKKQKQATTEAYHDLLKIENEHYIFYQYEAQETQVCHECTNGVERLKNEQDYPCSKFLLEDLFYIKINPN